MGFITWLGKTTLKIGVVAAGKPYFCRRFYKLISAVKISIDNHVWDLQTIDGEKEMDIIRKNVLPGTIVFREEVSDLFI